MMSPTVLVLAIHAAACLLDLGQRFGDDQRFGMRLNAAAARLDPEIFTFLLPADLIYAPLVLDLPRLSRAT